MSNLNRKLVDVKIRFLRNALFAIAIVDGELSDTEIKVLHSIDFNLDLLQDSVDSGYRDNLLSKRQKSDIYLILNKIENDAVSIAMFDECLTGDNNRLLEALRTTLIEFQKLVIDYYGYHIYV